jgi:hypothetical protein
MGSDERKNKDLCNITSNIYPLVDRLNTLEKMYRDASNTTKYIKNAVYTNPGYRHLPMTSPGFGK